MARITHRERLALVVCAAVVALTAGYYLGYRQYVAYRESLLEEIAQRRKDLTSFRRLLGRAEAIAEERRRLEQALEASNNLFLHREVGGVLQKEGILQSQLQGRLTNLMPELDLRPSGGTFGRGGQEDRITVRLNGNGTLPEITSFLEKMEALRDPLVFVDSLTLSGIEAHRERKKDEEGPQEEEIRVRMSLTVYARIEEEKVQ